MSTMRDHQKHVKDVQEGYSQHNTLPALENNGMGGPSNGREKSSTENPQSPGSGDDDEVRVNSELVTLWTQRLQVLTVVTSFLASMDGQLFSLSALNTQIGIPVGTASRETVYSCLAGALIFHICAAILAYVASFALVRYQIVETIVEDETKVGGIPTSGLVAAPPAQRHSRRVVAESLHPLQLFMTLLQPPARLRFLCVSRSSRSTPPPPPLYLLTRCFHTTLALTALGFILALTGILAYVWAGLPLVVGISATVCVGVGLSTAVWAIAM